MPPPQKKNETKNGEPLKSAVGGFPFNGSSLRLGPEESPSPRLLLRLRLVGGLVRKVGTQRLVASGFRRFKPPVASP